MASITNLNRFRKRKAREEKAKRAEQNLRLSGRTKAEKTTEAAQRLRQKGLLDGAFLEKLGETGGAEPTAAVALAQLNALAETAPTLSELSRKLATKSDSESGSET